MNEIRVKTQSLLDTATLFTSGQPKPDDLIKDNEIYFGYDLSKIYTNSDFGNNYTYRVEINGRLAKLINKTQNNVEMMDNALTELETILKGMNFKLNSRDVTMDNIVAKYNVTGYVIYNELNNEIIR